MLNNILFFKNNYVNTNIICNVLHSRLHAITNNAINFMDNFWNLTSLNNFCSDALHLISLYSYELK